MSDYIGRKGLILSFDAHRALGDLELEGGERVRFGGAAVAQLDPAPGTEVVVVDVGHTYSGELKVTRLALVGEPTLAGAVWHGDASSSPPGKSFDLATFARHHPDWLSDAVATRLARPAIAGPTLLRTTLRPHPFFDPWRDAVAQTAALKLGLTYRLGKVAPGESRVGGTAAELSGPWPTCSVCTHPLTLIAQLYLSEFPALFDEGGVLTLMLCLDHLPADHAELTSGRGWVGYVPDGAPHETLHRTLGERLRTAKSPERRIEAVPHVSFPSSLALTQVLKSPVASELFSVWLEPSKQSGAEAYEEWVNHGEPSSRLGGYPRWSSADRTPNCPTCAAPMALAIELTEDTGFALGGAVALFACRLTSQCAGLAGVRYQRA